MSDVFTKQKRSQVMAAVRSKGNKTTELKFARILRSHCISGWRRHLPLHGKPDFAFPRERLAVFVDGCFWHGCRWHCRIPEQNGPYWQNKIGRNRVRDRETTEALAQKGWRVLRIWEHSLASAIAVASRVKTELRLATRNSSITKG